MGTTFSSSIRQLKDIRLFQFPAIMNRAAVSVAKQVSGMGCRDLGVYAKKRDHWVEREM